MFDILGMIFWKLLEKPLFSAPKIFWQLGKLDDFRNYFLGALGDALILIFMYHV